jgi:hypothetical protein
MKRQNQKQIQTNQVKTQRQIVEEIAMEHCHHSYEFVDALSTEEEDIYKELWRCIFCGRLRVINIHTGIRD